MSGPVHGDSTSSFSLVRSVPQSHSLRGKTTLHRKQPRLGLAQITAEGRLSIRTPDCQTPKLVRVLVMDATEPKVMMMYCCAVKLPRLQPASATPQFSSSTKASTTTSNFPPTWFLQLRNRSSCYSLPHVY